MRPRCARPLTEWPLRQVAAPRLGRAMELLWFARAAGAAARREGADLVLSFARIVDADILRSGGGAHSSYLRAARQWQNSASSDCDDAQPLPSRADDRRAAGFAFAALASGRSRCPISCAPISSRPSPFRPRAGGYTLQWRRIRINSYPRRMRPSVARFGANWRERFAARP